MTSFVGIKEITGKETYAVKPWPDNDVIRIELDDVSFTNPNDLVKVTVECSWDGGKTFPWLDTTTWNGGAKAHDGSPPFVGLGPFKDYDSEKKQEKINNPSHLKVSLEAVSGAPQIGLKGNF